MAEAFDHADWLFEVKYDGFRALLENRRRRRASCLAQPQSVQASRHPRGALTKRLRVKEAILDGEVICVDETGRPIFLEMLRGRHPVCFVTFDLLCQRRGLAPAAAR
jgi:bifunctional non-homologous end joining protein LigD